MQGLHSPKSKSTGFYRLEILTIVQPIICTKWTSNIKYHCHKNIKYNKLITATAVQLVRSNKLSLHTNSI